MTQKSIELLKNKKGFFLQVEGASIDKQDHAANACGQIGETVAFDAAVKTALDFAKKDGSTTVLVTADHGHTSQIVETGTNTPGLTVTLETADKAPMTLSYGTAPAGSSQEHTGTQVRTAGYGPQAANVVGLTDQTDLHFTHRPRAGAQDPGEGLAPPCTRSVRTAAYLGCSRAGRFPSGCAGGVRLSSSRRQRS